MSFDQGIMTEATKQIFSDSKRTVVIYRATKKTSPITGTEELTYPETGTSIEIIFFKTAVRFEFGLEGLLEMGDCLIFDKPDNNNISRNDKIVADGETFLVKDVVPWRSREDHIYDAATGYKV